MGKLENPEAGWWGQGVSCPYWGLVGVFWVECELRSLDPWKAINCVTLFRCELEFYGKQFIPNSKQLKVNSPKNYVANKKEFSELQRCNSSDLERSRTNGMWLDPWKYMLGLWSTCLCVWLSTLHLLVIILAVFLCHVTSPLFASSCPANDSLIYKSLLMTTCWWGEWCDGIMILFWRVRLTPKIRRKINQRHLEGPGGGGGGG